MVEQAEHVGDAAPFLEWAFAKEDLRSLIEEAARSGKAELAYAECAYHTGRFEEAVLIADAVVQHGDLSEKAMAQCLQMLSMVAVDDTDRALVYLGEVKKTCSEGLKLPVDSMGYNVSMIVSRMLGGYTLALDEESERSLDDMSHVPQRLQVYSGFQLSYRTYFKHEYEQTLGITRSFLSIAGDKYPVSSAKLHLIAAAAHLRMKEVDAAADEYMKAWEYVGSLGIVMPFAELNSFIPGLARHCLRNRDEERYLSLVPIVRRRRVGWANFIARCHRMRTGEYLTMLEYCTAVLAAWDWSNKEIAHYLEISENTTKHYLTSVYQKVGVKNRHDLLTLVSYESNNWYFQH